MSELIRQAALLLTAAGLICLGLAAMLARSWRAGLRMALDLWMAAGLLRLGLHTHGTDLAGAAAIVAIRQLISLGLRHPGTRWAPLTPRRRVR